MSNGRPVVVPPAKQPVAAVVPSAPPIEPAAAAAPRAPAKQPSAPKQESKRPTGGAHPAAAAAAPAGEKKSLPAVPPTPGYSPKPPGLPPASDAAASAAGAAAEEEKSGLPRSTSGFEVDSKNITVRNKKKDLNKSGSGERLTQTVAMGPEQFAALSAELNKDQALTAKQLEAMNAAQQDKDRQALLNQGGIRRSLSSTGYQAQSHATPKRQPPPPPRSTPTHAASPAAAASSPAAAPWSPSDPSFAAVVLGPTPLGTPDTTNAALKQTLLDKGRRSDGHDSDGYDDKPIAQRTEVSKYCYASQTALYNGLHIPAAAVPVTLVSQFLNLEELTGGLIFNGAVVGGGLNALIGKGIEFWTQNKLKIGLNEFYEDADKDVNACKPVSLSLTAAFTSLVGLYFAQYINLDNLIENPLARTFVKGMTGSAASLGTYKLIEMLIRFSAELPFPDYESMPPYEKGMQDHIPDFILDSLLASSFIWIVKEGMKQGDTASLFLNPMTIGFTCLLALKLGLFFTSGQPREKIAELGGARQGMKPHMLGMAFASTYCIIVQAAKIGGADINPETLLNMTAAQTALHGTASVAMYKAGYQLGLRLFKPKSPESDLEVGLGNIQQLGQPLKKGRGKCCC